MLEIRSLTCLPYLLQVEAFTLQRDGQTLLRLADYRMPLVFMDRVCRTIQRAHHLWRPPTQGFSRLSALSASLALFLE